jgi:hypothetical protein
VQTDVRGRGAAWFAIAGERIDTVQVLLLGMTVLLLPMQADLTTGYRRLRSHLGFWSFTFPFCSIGSYGVEWLHLTHVLGAAVWSWLLVAAITVLVGGVAWRSIRGLRRSCGVEEVLSADDELLHGHGRAIAGDLKGVSCHGRRRSGSRCDIAQVLDQMGRLAQGSQSVGELLDTDGLVADGNPSARETALAISW